MHLAIPSSGTIAGRLFIRYHGYSFDADPVMSSRVVDILNHYLHCELWKADSAPNDIRGWRICNLIPLSCDFQRSLP